MPLRCHWKYDRNPVDLTVHIHTTLTSFENKLKGIEVDNL